jgi:hypothetical protein
MVRITISDLSPGDDGKFITELSTWEMQTVYAGLERRFGGANINPVETTPQQPETSFSFNNANTDLDQWMDTLETQIKDLRSQLGIA